MFLYRCSSPGSPVDEPEDQFRPPIQVLTYKSTRFTITLMETSTDELSTLLTAITHTARLRGLNDSQWAAAAGLPKETLSRLRRRTSCDLSTLVCLASAVGARLAIVPAAPVKTTPDGHFPDRVDRVYESRLLNLAASGSFDATAWRALGPAFFMAGVAVMLASRRGANRRTLIVLADTLHPGMSHPDVFNAWLVRSPLKPSRFLPMVRAQVRDAA